MAVGPAVADGLLLLEDDDLIAPYLVVKYSSFNNNILYYRFSDGYITIILNKQDLVKLNCFAGFGFKAVNKYLLTFFNFKLLTCNFNDCVHAYFFMFLCEAYI